jgi:16S rRNA (cytidine1402-2'-O)-methyltransferase
MPAVSDPGARIVAAVAEADLPVTVLPGPSAVTAAVAASGFGGAGFAFAGFLPRPAAKAAAEVRRLDACGLPVVAFESPQRLPATLAALAEAEPGRPAVVCRELSKLHEQVERGSLADLAQAFATPPKGEVTLVLAAADAAADAADVPEDVLAELVAAVGARRAAAIASRLTGVPRNRLYRAASSTKP